MIELFEGLPNNVVGVVVKGRVTPSDCANVLSPAVARAMQSHRRLRLYYQIRSRFPGAGWEEISLGIDPAPRWERIAIVCDVAWVRHMVQTLRLALPGEVRVFAGMETPQALAWISGSPALGSRRPQLTAGAGRSLRPARQFLYQPQ